VWVSPPREPIFEDAMRGGFIHWVAATLLVPVPAGAVDRPVASTRTRLEAVTRELVAAVERGDWAPWEKHTADALLYTTEFGRTMTRSELRALFRPVPAPERRTFTTFVVGFVTRGGAAVLVCDLRASGPGEVERYRVTATYGQAGEAWLLVAAHVGTAASDADLAEGGRR
jgi:hypothetical protein